MSKIEVEKLLSDHKLPEDALEITGLNCDELQSIHDDHLSQVSDLERVGDFVTGQLRRAGGVHSLKYRVKAPNHLVAKIIRKRIDDPERIINLENYRQEITDLVGIRALHLYKEDWGGIHDYIEATWDFQETPTANYREGDPPQWLEAFNERKCDVRCHPAGYRSVHYLIKSQPAKNIHIAEVQVRTIFEEAWSEVDHRIRYPDDMNNPILVPLLLFFNRLAGSADEIASYIQVLKSRTEEDKQQHAQALGDRDQKVSELIARIEQLEIATEEKTKLKEEVEEINTYDPAPSFSATPLGKSQVLGLEHPFANLGFFAGGTIGLDAFGIIGENNRRMEAIMKATRFPNFLSGSLISGSLTSSLISGNLANQDAAMRAIGESLGQYKSIFGGSPTKRLAEPSLKSIEVQSKATQPPEAAASINVPEPPEKKLSPPRRKKVST